MNDPSIMNDDERNLFQLIKMNDIDGLTRLLQQIRSTGTSLNNSCFNGVGFTPLVDAVNRNNTSSTEIITILLEYGADINIRSKERYYENIPDYVYENTALHVACEHGNVNTVKLLLLHGANPNVHNKYYGRTPLHNACIHYKVDVIKALLEYKADCNCRDSSHSTPLNFLVFFGIYNKKLDLLQPVLLLLDYGADVDNQEMTGETIIHTCIRAIVIKYNCIKIPDSVLMIIQVLVESHSNINAELEDTYCNGYENRCLGITLLHCAVRYEVFDIVKILVEYHATSFSNVESALKIAKTILESIPLIENDRKSRLQSIVSYIEGWQRQHIYLYLLNRWGMQYDQIEEATSASSSSSSSSPLNMKSNQTYLV